MNKIIDLNYFPAILYLWIIDETDYCLSEYCFAEEKPSDGYRIYHQTESALTAPKYIMAGFVGDIDPCPSAPHSVYLEKAINGDYFIL